jgi:hypothetical protein
MLKASSLLVTVVISCALLFPQSTGKTPAPQKHLPHVPISPVSPRSEDVSTIDGIVKAYFEVVSGPAGQPRQWGRDATLYIPNVRFIIFSEDAAGNTIARSMTHPEFVDSSNASLTGKAFYEHEVHRVTHRAGDVVHILSTSEHMSNPEGPAQGRSIDSLELFWDGSRWWIANVGIWDVNASKHPLPAEFLP